MRREPTTDELAALRLHSAKVLAKSAGVDERTVLRIKAGEHCHSLFIERVVSAAARLGCVDPIGEGPRAA